MSAKVLWDVVRAVAARADIEKPAPHDLRRTCARLTLGYRHLGNLGIEGREAFASPNMAPRHHLYVCPKDSRSCIPNMTVTPP